MRRLVQIGALAGCLLPACRRADPWPTTAFQERRIYNACQAFASVNGKLPAALDDLVPDFLPDRRSLSDPDHPEEGEIGYYYYGSESTGSEPSAAIFLASKAERRGRHALIQFGGKALIASFRPPRP